MTMYYTVNTTFMHYLDSFKKKLEIPSLDVNQNWTIQEQVLPISLQSPHFDSKLLKVPETLKGLAQQYKQNGQTLNINKNKTKSKFFDNIARTSFYL